MVDDTYDKKLIPAGVAARLLHVPSGWLKDEARSGRLPALDAGGRLLFHLPTVRKILLDRVLSDRADGGHSSAA